MARRNNFRQGRWRPGDLRPRTIRPHGTLPSFPSSGHRPGGHRWNPSAWPRRFAFDGHAVELGRSTASSWDRAGRDIALRVAACAGPSREPVPHRETGWPPRSVGRMRQAGGQIVANEPSPVTGSVVGEGRCSMRSLASCVGAWRQMSQCWSGGYAPTTRKSSLASIRQCPVPAGRSATSPVSTITARPFGPPSTRRARPPANPNTSCAVEW